jgi:hypothetical protein
MYRMRFLPWTLMLAAIMAGLGAVLVAGCNHKSALDDEPPPPRPIVPTANLAERVHEFCGACHSYPPPETFPRKYWKDEVERGYRFFGRSGMALVAPPITEVVKYYEDRAPEELPSAKIERASGPCPVRFEQVHFPPPKGVPAACISNVNLVHLSDPKRLDVLATDMKAGLLLLLKPYEPNPTWRVLAQVPNPAHTEVVDLDGDGIKDILVANLGNFAPTDRLCGSVVWLRGNKDGSYTPYTLLEGVGRVADVQAADFRGVGKFDLVVAAFGWNSTGEIYHLENQTTDWSKPHFVPHVLDKRHGAIHVPVARLQGQRPDQPPDFVALISQEHETVVAFLNDGRGTFRKETLFQAAHPAYGSSGIQLVDLNGDGNPDVLYTNGDTLDKPYLLKPYHGIQWLENPGKGWWKRPGEAASLWKHHPIAPMYGVHRALAADFRGTGKKDQLDIVAVCFLPPEAFPQRSEQQLDAIIYLKQLAPGKFARYTLESVTCDHVTCAVGDIYGSGRIDFVTGPFQGGKASTANSPHGLTIWRNLGP